jgi:hypothetical protein
MSKESLSRMLLAVSATHEDAATKGLKRGNGGTGSVKCPACEMGIIKYSVASLNGHIWGACSTKGCVQWME